jgi:outer membrane lipoprotein-sorting protein
MLAAALILPLTLSGCSLLFFRTRKLPLPQMPNTVLTAKPDELVAQLNQRWEQVESLNATVDIQASIEKSAEGIARDYSNFRGIILLRKPGKLRVFGRVPVVGITMFDMATDGSNFTLYVPSKSKAIKGSNKMKKKSANQFENLRPDFFYDAMFVRGLEPDDNFSVIADTDTLLDPAKKHFVVTPQYVINITRSHTNGHEETPVRVITLNRTNLLPYRQDLYDDEGNLVTQVVYSDYGDFGFGPYPGTITIKRPLEQFQLVLTVDKIVRNMPLTDDQFAVKVPPGTDVQNLE